MLEEIFDSAFPAGRGRVSGSIRIAEASDIPLFIYDTWGGGYREMNVIIIYELEPVHEKLAVKIKKFQTALIHTILGVQRIFLAM